MASHLQVASEHP